MNALMEAIGIRHPIIQAPMAGGATTPELVAAVSNAGGLGFIAAAYLSSDGIQRFGEAVRQRTEKPFGINLFAPLNEEPAPASVEAALDFMAPFHRELGLEPPVAPSRSQERFEDQFEAALEAGASALSFTFGMLPDWAMRAIKERGMLVFGTATTVLEARMLSDSGVDAVVAQGSEAGAHRGSFAVSFEDAMVGTMALVAGIAAAVDVPVIASGGIMNGRGIRAAEVLGASAVQMGTAFLTTAESGIPEVYRQALRSAEGHGTRVTRAFSGRPARGIVNRFLEAAEAAPTGSILPYPLQNALTRPMRNAAGSQGRAEFLSLWAGQGVGLTRELPAGELVEVLAREALEAAREP